MHFLYLIYERVLLSQKIQKHLRCLGSDSWLTAWGASCFEGWCADGLGARERKGKEGNRRDRKGKEGKGRERKGKEGKGRERKGKEGKGRERKGKEGKGRERKETEGTGRERKGKERRG